MWRARPQYCQIVRYAGSLITLFTDLVQDGLCLKINYDISMLGENGCWGNETSNVIKQERVKGNCQFVLSVVAVIECTLRMITFVSEYCRACVGMHTDRMCHKEGPMCRWQNTAINVIGLLKAVQGTAARHGTAQHGRTLHVFLFPHHKYTGRGMFRLVHTKPSSGHILHKPYIAVKSRTTSEDNSM